jgi:release factor glutamine methyltransferase
VPLEARSLVSIALNHYFRLSMPQILANYEIVDSIYHKNIEVFNESIQRLLNQEPIQYIIGKTTFCGMELQVNQHVLIPRPETEELVQIIIKEHKDLLTLKILDLGAGSGCIPIALKKAIPHAEILACDISEMALKVAKSNAGHEKTNIDFFKADMRQIADYEHIEVQDIFVSNPPYVLQLEKNQMQNNVLKFEPHLALFVENSNPLEFYIACLKLAEIKLKIGGKVYFEINHAFGNEMKALLESFAYKNINIVADLNNKARFAIAERSIHTQII